MSSLSSSPQPASSATATASTAARIRVVDRLAPIGGESLLGDTGRVAVAAADADPRSGPAFRLDQVPQPAQGRAPISLAPERGSAERLLEPIHGVGGLGPVDDARVGHLTAARLELPDRVHRDPVVAAAPSLLRDPVGLGEGDD